MAYRCDYDECLFATQQVCARTGSPTPCEHAYDEDDDSPIAPEDPEEPAANRTEAPGEGARPALQLGVHTGEELGLKEVEALFDEQYTHTITILGDRAAGKTSFLVCLYLACGCGMIESHGLTFAGSLTLPGFEARARSSRIWSKAGAPDRMTERTVLGEDRGGGFMHLDLVENETGRRIRLLMSDLPGEWTNDLVNHARFAYRLPFLGRSDAILVMIDGQELIGPQRHGVVDRNITLLDRLAELLGAHRAPLIFVATRYDKLEADPPALTSLVTEAAARGFPSKSAVICTFSQSQDCESGRGTIELIKDCVLNTPRGGETWPQATPERLFGWGYVTSGGMIGD